MLADAAGIDDAAKCKYLFAYSKGKAAEYIESLEAYEKRDWSTLVKELRDVYPSAEEEKAYTMKMLRNYAAMTWQIETKAQFDKYYREFVIMSKGLKKKGLLTVTVENGMFWEGIGPKQIWC